MARGNQRELAREKAQKKQAELARRKGAHDKDSNKVTIGFYDIKL